MVGDFLLKYGEVSALSPVRPRHHRSVHNYIIDNHPLRTGEESFIYRVDDFVAVKGYRDQNHGSGTAAWIESVIARRPNSWLHVRAIVC